VNTVTLPDTTALSDTAELSGTQRPPDHELLGVWQKVGYNEIFELTTTHCQHYFSTKTALVFDEQKPLSNFLADVKSVKQLTPDTLEIRWYDSIIPYQLKRLPVLPKISIFTDPQTPEARDPQVNLEFLLATLTTHFAFAKERGIDWADLAKKARANVKADTSDESLFEVMAEMIRLLDDRHARFRGLDRKIFVEGSAEIALNAAWDEVATSQGQTQEAVSLDYATNRVLNGRASTGANNKLVWGHLDGDLGYLFFLDCYDFCEHNPEASDSEQLASLASALDHAMTDLQATKGMVIDLRFNGGGMDAASLEVVSRFTDKPRLAFSKHAVLKGQPLTSHDVFVTPSQRVRYQKPFSVLVSVATCSAAEIATLGFRVLPQGTILGQPTWGGLSDSMSFKLPNGWGGQLSNEMYIAADGQWYENLGIPPAMVTPTPSLGNFWPALDEGLVEACKVLETSSREKV
jgi:carboxyl-terminal processing protease